MRTLDQRELAILDQLQSDPTIDIPTIAERLSLSRSSARYLVDKLHSDNVLIRPAPFIDVTRLGYTEYAMYVILRSDSLTAFDLSSIDQRSLNGVSLVARLGGEYNALVCLYAKTVSEANQIFHRFTNAAAWKILKKTVSIRVSFDFLGYRYFSPSHRKNQKVLSLSHTSLAHGLDPTDHLTLATMASRGDLSRREMARRLGLPHSTLENRIRRLESRGLIRGYEYLFNPERIGIQMYRVLVRSGQCHGKTRDRFRYLGTQSAHIVTVAECMGDWDFELGVHVPVESSTTQLHDIISTHVSGDTVSVESIPTLQYLRVMPFPFDEWITQSVTNSQELASVG